MIRRLAAPLLLAAAAFLHAPHAALAQGATAENPPHPHPTAPSVAKQILPPPPPPPTPPTPSNPRKLAVPPGGEGGATGVAINGSINDLQLLPVLEGMTDTYTIALNSIPSASCTVRVRAESNNSDVTVDGGDSPLTRTLSFTSSTWNTAQTVTVSGLQDDDGVDDDAVISHSIPADGACYADGYYTRSAGANTRPITIPTVTVSVTDDDQVTLVLTPIRITETGGVSTVTARSWGGGPLSEAVTVTVAAAAVASTELFAGSVAEDFTLSTKRTLTIAAGAATSAGTVTVTANGNDVDTATKLVRVSGTAAGSTARTVLASVLRLTDDDGPPGVSLSLNPASVSENGGVSTVTATLSHPSGAATTVTLAPVAGAYTAGSDATIVIAAGSTANASDTATVTAVDDTIHQGSSGRSVTVTASPTNGYGAGTVTGAALTLTDNEALPTVSLALAPSSIAEEGGVSTVTATLSGVSSDAVTVTVAAAAGTRAAAADFTLSTAATLTIAAGSTASAGTVTVTANGNNVLSGSKEVTVSGTAAGGNGAADPSGATLTITDDEGPAADIASPFILTAATLNNASVLVRLFRTAFASGVGASSFEVVTSPAVAGLSIAGVTGGSAGGTTATLRLAWSGTTLAADAKLKVRVLAAAHAGATDLETAEIDVLAAADTAPSFPAVTLPGKYFLMGEPIVPFQVPAATGGNGDITYTVANLPAGLRFDATGTDADGCPGTTPRTVCGTPTTPLPYNLSTQFIAQDADSDPSHGDRGYQQINLRIYGSLISSTNPSPLASATLNTATVTVSLRNTSFNSGVTASDFELVTGIPNLSISQVSGAAGGGTTATLTLAFTGEITTDQTLAVKIKASAHNRTGDLTTPAVIVVTTGDTAPSFPAATLSANFATLPAKYFPAGETIQPFQIPAATGGNGTISYSYTALPPGLKFDAGGSDAFGCTAADFPAGYTDTANLAAAPRVVCGTPGVSGITGSKFVARDADPNRSGSDQGTLAVDIHVYDASISSTNPSRLTKANLNTATIGVLLAQTTFNSSVTASDFELVTNIPNLSISQVSGAVSGSTAATLTLAFTGDFPTDRTLAVKVGASAHSRGTDLTTGAVQVTPTVVTDTRPHFSGYLGHVYERYVRVPVWRFPLRIAPFQIPAATGGNGALSYSAHAGSRVLKFDATGSDAGGCTAADFPAGYPDTANLAAAPRVICGLVTNSSHAQASTRIIVRDSDTNRGPGDQAEMRVRVLGYGARIRETRPSRLTESGLNGARLRLLLRSTKFLDRPISPSDFELVTDIPNLSISQVSVESHPKSKPLFYRTHAYLTLAFTGDFDTPRTLAVRVKDAAHTLIGDLTTDAVTVPPGAGDTAPSFGGASVPDKDFPGGALIVPFQVPAAAGGNGDITYTVAGLPAGLRFDATGSDAGGCTAADFPTGFADTANLAAAPRVVCGMPVRDLSSIVVVTAHDADANRAASDGARLSFTFTVDTRYGLDVGAVSGSATEAGGTATFPVALRTQPTAAVTVSVSGRDGSEGTAAPPSLTFAPSAWNTARTVTVTGVQDTVDDGTVTWRVRLDPSSGDTDYAGLGDTDVDVTTTDDDGPPGVVLSLSPSSVSENGGISTVTATLSHPSSAATTLTVSPIPGAYTAGSDATIVIAAGRTANASDTAMVAAVDNTTDEPDRTATVTATVANDRAAADSTTMAVTGAALTLTDDEAPPTVSLSLSPTSIAEEGGVSTVTATLSGVSSEALTVTVAATAGTRAAAADFTLSTATTLTIAAGSTASAGTVTVRANGNNAASGSKRVTVSGTSAGGNGAADPAAATLTITDDDTPQASPSLSLSPSSISENGGVATVTAVLDRQPSVAVTVTVAASAGTGAVAGDFTLGAARTLTFAANATVSAGLVTVTATDNTTDAPDKSVTVSGTASDGLGLAADPSGVTLTITDDDAAPAAALFLAPALVSENGGVSTVTAVLSNPSSEPSTVAVSAVSGLYAVGTDATIVIPAGSTAAPSDTVLVTAVDDDIHQGPAGRAATLSASLANGRGAGAVMGATLTLTDDETSPTVSLALSPASIAEEGGVSTVTAGLSGLSSEAVTVTVAAAAGAGAVTGDFTLGAARTLTIAAGSTTGAGTVTVMANGNLAASGSKSVTVSGTSAGGNGAADPADATLTITDDEVPQVTLSLSPSSISENGGVATVTAVLGRQSSSAVTVTVAAAAEANASAGDFTLGAARTLTFAANATASTGVVTVTATDNTTDAPDRSVTVSGTVSGPANDPSGVTLTIADDDAAPDAVLSVNPGLVSENGGVSTVTAVLSHPSSEPTTVTVTTVAGAYTAGSDATIVIAAGATTAASDRATVTAADDDIYQGHAQDGVSTRSWSRTKRTTVTAGLANGQGAGTVTGASLIITDDETRPTLSLVLSPGSITETNGVSTVTATLTGRSSEVLTVTVSAAGVASTGAVSGDFTLSTARTLTIAAGSTTSTGAVTVTANGNGVGTADKSVTVSGTASGGNGVDGPSDVILTLEDDDTAGIAVSPWTSSTNRLVTTESGRDGDFRGGVGHPADGERGARHGEFGHGRGHGCAVGPDLHAFGLGRGADGGADGCGRYAGRDRRHPELHRDPDRRPNGHAGFHLRHAPRADGLRRATATTISAWPWER